MIGWMQQRAYLKSLKAEQPPIREAGHLKKKKKKKKKKSEVGEIGRPSA